MPMDGQKRTKVLKRVEKCIKMYKNVSRKNIETRFIMGYNNAVYIFDINEG